MTFNFSGIFNNPTKDILEKIQAKYICSAVYSIRKCIQLTQLFGLLNFSFRKIRSFSLTDINLPVREEYKRNTSLTRRFMSVKETL